MQSTRWWTILNRTGRQVPCLGNQKHWLRYRVSNGCQSRWTTGGRQLRAGYGQCPGGRQTFRVGRAAGTIQDSRRKLTTMNDIYTPILRDWIYPLAQRVQNRNYSKLMTEAIKNQFLSQDELQNIQFNKLTALLHHAYNSVPHYRDTFDSVGLKPEDIRSWDDFPRFRFCRRNKFGKILMDSFREIYVHLYAGFEQADRLAPHWDFISVRLLLHRQT